MLEKQSVALVESNETIETFVSNEEIEEKWDHDFDERNLISKQERKKIRLAKMNRFLNYGIGVTLVLLIIILYIAFSK